MVNKDKEGLTFDR